MREDKPKLMVIVGSTREGRFGPVVAGWFARQAAEHGGMDAELLDLAEARLPAELGPVPTPEVAAVTARLDAADAFAVVTPEYNHSFPAPLKTLIDWPLPASRTLTPRESHTHSPRVAHWLPASRTLARVGVGFTAGKGAPPCRG